MKSFLVPPGRVRRVAYFLFLSSAACVTTPSFAQSAYPYSGNAVNTSVPVTATGAGLPNVVSFVIKAAGGGAGGNDSGWGGNGAAGSAASGAVQVMPGQSISLFVGGKGAGGTNTGLGNPANTLLGKGGAGGNGLGAGGQGGDSGLTPQGTSGARASGGGGGGGGASSLNVGGLTWVTVGGGGGAGGGSSRWGPPVNASSNVPATRVNYDSYGPYLGAGGFTPPANPYWNASVPGTAGVGMNGGTRYQSTQPAAITGQSVVLLNYAVATQTPTFIQSAGCKTPVAGAVGGTTATTTAPYQVDGGGAGGGGGSFDGGVMPSASAGNDNRWVAEGGAIGNSCYQGYYEASAAPGQPTPGATDFVPAGGGAGGVNVNADRSGVDGAITLVFSHDPDRVPGLSQPVASNGSIQTNIASALLTPPGQEVAQYRVSCTSSTPGSQTPLTVTSAVAGKVSLAGATAGATYACDVVASLRDVATQAATIDTLHSAPLMVKVPGLPAITQAIPGNTQSTLTITPPGNLPAGVSVRNYSAICTPTNPAGPAVTATLAAASPGVMTGLVNGTSYDCQVSANLSDNTVAGPSNTASVALIAAPVITSTWSGDGKGKLEITPPGNLPTGVSVASYSASCTPGPVSASGLAPLALSGLTNGAVYSCTVVARLSDGSDSPVSNVGTVAPKAVTAPVITDAASGDKQGTLTITQPGNLPSGVTVKDYTATCGPGNIKVTGAQPLTIGGLTNGTTYTCTVVANLSDGSASPVSNSASITPSAVVINASPVPTLGEWGVLVLSVLAMLIAALKLRRRKTPA